MYDSDKNYFSKFELDPTIDASWENLYGFDLSHSNDGEPDIFYDKNMMEEEDLILEEDGPLKIERSIRRQGSGTDF